MWTDIKSDRYLDTSGGEIMAQRGSQTVSRSQPTRSVPRQAVSMRPTPHSTASCTGPKPPHAPTEHIERSHPVRAAGVPLKALYRIPDAMALLSMSRTVIYEQIRAGRLRSVTQGRTRLISATAIAEYVALLEGETMRRTA